MLYTLMNKDAELFDIEMSSGNIRRIENLRQENKDLFPVFLAGLSSSGIDGVIAWWQSRRIPESRDGVKELLFNLGLSLDTLAEKSLGLSLSDHYWIRPSKDIAWKDVNFFQNDFSGDIGDLLISGEWNGGSLASPDNSSDGAVKKRWKIIGGERYLIKGSSEPFYQTEPFREVFASRLAELLFPRDFAVSYDLVWGNSSKADKKVYSACKNFVTADTEYVPFTHFREIESKAYKLEHFEVCARICGEHSSVLDLILILDYIVLNEDRHFGNFGMIRNANTGELIKPAPVFDTGSSLFHDSVVIDPQTLRAKPFAKDFDDQIKLVRISDYYEKIRTVKENVAQIFWKSFADAFEAQGRLTEMLNAVKSQIDRLLSVKP